MAVRQRVRAIRGGVREQRRQARELEVKDPRKAAGRYRKVAPVLPIAGTAIGALGGVPGMFVGGGLGLVAGEAFRRRGISVAEAGGRKKLAEAGAAVPEEFRFGNYAEMLERMEAAARILNPEMTEQTSPVRVASREAQDRFKFVALMDRISQMNPLELRKLIDELIGQDASADFAHEADAALYLAFSALKQQYELGAETEEGKAVLHDQEIAELQARMLERQSAINAALLLTEDQRTREQNELVAQYNRAELLKAQIGAIEMAETGIAALEGGVDYWQLQKAAVREIWTDNNRRINPISSQGEAAYSARDIAVDAERAVLTRRRERIWFDLKHLPGDLNAARKVFAVRRSVGQFARNLGRTIQVGFEKGEYFNRQLTDEQASIDQTNRRLLEAGINELEAMLKGANIPEAKVLEEQSLEYFDRFRGMFYNMPSNHDLDTLVRNDFLPGQTEIDAMGLPKWQEYVQLAVEIEQAKIAEADAVIARYREEYAEFLTNGPGNMNVSEQAVLARLNQENPLLVARHNRYDGVRQALAETNQGQLTRAEQILIEMEQNLAGAEQIYRDAYTRKQQEIMTRTGNQPRRSEVEAAMDRRIVENKNTLERVRNLVQVAGGSSPSQQEISAVGNFLAGELSRLQEQEIAYQEARKVTEQNLRTNISYTDEQLIQRLPPEFGEAVNQRETSEESLRYYYEHFTQVRMPTTAEFVALRNELLVTFMRMRARIPMLQFERLGIANDNVSILLKIEEFRGKLALPDSDPIAVMAELQAYLAGRKSELGVELVKSMVPEQARIHSLKSEKEVHVTNAEYLAALGVEAKAVSDRLEFQLRDAFGPDFIELAGAERTALRAAQETHNGVKEVLGAIFGNSEVPPGEKERLAEWFEGEIEHLTEMGVAGWDEDQMYEYASGLAGQFGLNGFDEGALRSQVRDIRRKSRGGVGSLISNLSNALLGVKSSGGGKRVVPNRRQKVSTGAGRSGRNLRQKRVNHS